jgi:hypothetical protein
MEKNIVIDLQEMWCEDVDWSKLRAFVDTAMEVWIPLWGMKIYQQSFCLGRGLTMGRPKKSDQLYVRFVITEGKPELEQATGVYFTKAEMLSCLFNDDFSIKTLITSI